MNHNVMICRISDMGLIWKSCLTPKGVKILRLRTDGLWEHGIPNNRYPTVFKIWVESRSCCGYASKARQEEDCRLTWAMVLWSACPIRQKVVCVVVFHFYLCYNVDYRGLKRNTSIYYLPVLEIKGWHNSIQLDLRCGQSCIPFLKGIGRNQLPCLSPRLKMPYTSRA